MAQEAQQVSTTDDKEQLWRIAATAVLIDHVRVLTSTDTLPVTFQISQLSWWATTFLECSLPHVCKELTAHGVSLLLSESAEEWRLTKIDEVAPDNLRDLSRRVCKPISGISIDWLAHLGKVVSSIAEVVIAQIGDLFDLSPLRKVSVNHAVMFDEEWSVPYEICWQADGANNTITMPNVPQFKKKHFDHFAEYLGLHEPEQTLLYQYLGCFLIPCHEVLHIVQHLHGNLRDPDPQSYAMEHDASRLNYVLLWHVLQLDETLPAWCRSVVMLEAINRAVSIQKLFSSEFVDKLPAYRRWADSFGLISPAADFADGSSDERKLRLENLSKFLIAGEALACRGGRAPSADMLAALLRAAFSPSRQGDVYSEANRSVVESLLPPDLRLDSSANFWLSSPAAFDAEERKQVCDRLQSAWRSANVRPSN